MAFGARRGEGGRPEGIRLAMSAGGKTMSEFGATSIVARRGNSLGVFWTVLVVVGIVAGCLFTAFPEVDLLVSRAFFSSQHGFFGHRVDWVKNLRWTFVCLYWASLVISICGVVATRVLKRNWLRMAFAQWLFLVICLGTGPGLIANVILKDHWGRARPSQLAEFGGQRTFTPPLLPSNQCKRNCSFISGEASAIFAPFYAAAFVVPQWWAALVTIGTVGGLMAGMIRVSQGAHFLSDIIFAGVFMALTIAALYELIFRTVLSRSRAR